jgi:RNA polymerase-binding transcription factor DksA
MLSHPWAARVIETRAEPGPATISYMDAIAAILLDGGFNVELAHHGLHVLGSRVLGFNQDLFDDKSAVDPDTAAAVAHELARLYPSVGAIALAASHEGGLGGCDDEVEFEFGLDLILEGLERERVRARHLHVAESCPGWATRRRRRPMDTEQARQLVARERQRVEAALRELAGDVAADAELELQQTGETDAGSELETEMVEVALQNDMRARLAAVERAEARIAAGSYGRSVESGDMIPDERLEADPLAERTVEEQRRFEAESG